MSSLRKKAWEYNKFLLPRTSAYAYTKKSIRMFIVSNNKGGL
jgi:hypothetical protein